MQLVYSTAPADWTTQPWGNAAGIMKTKRGSQGNCEVKWNMKREQDSHRIHKYFSLVLKKKKKKKKKKYLNLHFESMYLPTPSTTGKKNVTQGQF